ncbi:hypothetical protein ANCCEY_01350 [Ancylostoma ceylanicum]|uniref:Major facilitator superfamily (MFS) profile domain-containing protein n=1 Tax=Ancylostoma ceylanicum TaxID=53326 RepID=A0A0D6M5X5_9BILA|nr:hypothetical protein ANCCEY_01350 [Ancylostoma ceylanicum]
MTTEQQLMVSSNSASGVPIDDKSFVRKPEDVLDKLGTRHKGLITAIVSCSFVWGFGALSIMSSAFTSIDCGNCTDTMLTVVSEFGLRGDRAYLAEWSTSFFMIGNMIGGCTLSHAADRFGRRPILLLCLTFQALSALLASFSKSVHIFSICRLLQGACYTGANLVAWVAAYEHTHTDFRSFTTFFFGATTCDNFIYFGLSLYSTQLAGNRYANYLLMGLVELPAYILGPISLER